MSYYNPAIHASPYNIPPPTSPRTQYQQEIYRNMNFGQTWQPSNHVYPTYRYNPRMRPRGRGPGFRSNSRSPWNNWNPPIDRSAISYLPHIPQQTERGRTPPQHNLNTNYYNNFQNPNYSYPRQTQTPPPLLPTPTTEGPLQTRPNNTQPRVDAHIVRPVNTNSYSLPTHAGNPKPMDTDFQEARQPCSV